MTDDTKPETIHASATQKAELAKFIKFHLGHYGPKDLKNIFPGLNLKRTVTKK